MMPSSLSGELTGGWGGGMGVRSTLWQSGLVVLVARLHCPSPLQASWSPRSTCAGTTSLRTRGMCGWMT